MKTCPNCGSPRESGQSECEKCGTDFVYLDEKEAQAAAEASKRQARRDRIVARINELVAAMDEKQLVAMLGHANEVYEKKDRAHPRIPCLIPADYLSLIHI